jgi:hypothetical protein
MAELLGKVGADDRKVLVLTSGNNPNVYLSGRNIPSVQVMNYHEASAYDILWSDTVLVEEAALTGVEPEVTEEPAAESRAPRAKKAAGETRPAKAKAARQTAAKAKAAKKETAKATKKAAKKTTAKKPATKAAKSPKKKGGK